MPRGDEHMEGLTPQQQRFVESYVKLGNATQAALEAGYSANSAHVQGSRLLKHDKVLSAVDVETARVSKAIGITQEWVLQGLKKEAELYEEGSAHGARVSAYNVLSKCLGMQLDRQHNTGELTVKIGVEDSEL